MCLSSALDIGTNDMYRYVRDQVKTETKECRDEDKTKT